MTESGLRKRADDFVSYKRTLGYIYDGQAWLLNKYVIFAESCVSAPDIPT